MRQPTERVKPNSRQRPTIRQKKAAPAAALRADQIPLNPVKLQSIALKDLVDLSHLERLEYFLGDLKIAEETVTAVKAEEMQKFHRNKMYIPFSNYEPDLLLQNLPRIMLSDSLIKKFSAAQHNNKIEKYVGAARGFNLCFDMLESTQSQYSAKDLSIIKYVIAYFMEASLLMHIDTVADKQLRVNLSAFLFRNDYTRADIEIEQALEFDNILDKTTKAEHGYVASMCNTFISTAFGMTLFSAKYDNVHSNPVTLHGVINARLIATLSKQQRELYVEGVIRSVNSSLRQTQQVRYPK